MIDIEKLLPLACTWAEEQQERILTYGQELNENQKIDAYLVGIKNIDQVRVLYVDEIPIPERDELLEAAEDAGLFAGQSRGVTYEYGIYIDKKWKLDRKLLVHELTHTAQYERLGSIKSFLAAYITECITLGYPHGDMEKEARVMAEKLGD